MKQRILLVEPSLIIQVGFTSIIESSGQFTVASTIDSLSQIREKIAQHRPDIVVINPAVIPYSRNISVANTISADADMPLCAAIVHEYVDSSLLRQFDATILIRDERESIINTLSSLKRENAKLNSTFNDTYELSPREKDVLVLVAKGMMSKEIADKLNISIHTVISHRKNITKKTGIKSVAGLAVYAILNNLMDEE